eukprot:UN32808
MPSSSSHDMDINRISRGEGMKPLQMNSDARQQSGGTNSQLRSYLNSKNSTVPKSPIIKTINSFTQNSSVPLLQHGSSNMMNPSNNNHLLSNINNNNHISQQNHNQSGLRNKMLNKQNIGGPNSGNPTSPSSSNHKLPNNSGSNYKSIFGALP